MQSNGYGVTSYKIEITLMLFTLKNMEKYYLKLQLILLDLLMMNPWQQWGKNKCYLDSTKNIEGRLNEGCCILK